MALGDAVAGAIHTAQTVTWQDEAGDAWSLVGATITGRMRPERGGGVARAITGTMALVGTGSTGQFTWTYSAVDAVKGVYWIQFKATFAVGGYDLSKPAKFEVLEAI